MTWPKMDLQFKIEKRTPDDLCIPYYKPTPRWYLIFEREGFSFTSDGFATEEDACLAFMQVANSITAHTFAGISQNTMAEIGEHYLLMTEGKLADLKYTPEEAHTVLYFYLRCAVHTRRILELRRRIGLHCQEILWPKDALYECNRCGEKKSGTEFDNFGALQLECRDCNARVAMYAEQQRREEAEFERKHRNGF